MDKAFDAIEKEISKVESELESSQGRSLRNLSELLYVDVLR